MWQEINSKLIAAILAYAVTVVREAKTATLEYVKECAMIDTHAGLFVKHEVFSSVNISDSSVQRYVSLLL